MNFAREHNLRLVVKGGGHSYQGTSNAADSLLVWTRAMDAITLHDAFVARRMCRQAGAAGGRDRRGRRDLDAHLRRGRRPDAGRYVQGGGCATVGVAGLIQSGGFGSFSKRYGTGGGGAARSRGRHRGRRRAHRQRLHESRICSGR